MALCAHAGTAASLPGYVMFDEGQAIIPTPKLESRWRTKEYEKEPVGDEEVYIDWMAHLTRRERVQMKALHQISSWLRFYNFRDMDANEQQVSIPSGCFRFRRPECTCPIHVAAKLGHETVVKSLLMARADPKRKTSRGRTALEIARKADVNGSHRETVEALEIAERAVSLRRAIEIMSN
ncbi:hypothetical protein AK812_SmicGene16414 [Symbiodinium microadriaticum]|uniref:Uncharacterized protein n=1 Tax=Symbiodinium microadriaticum TaxID=2951 RepID=A0A1Q9E0D3_SYMMI|nr:hypothetical protein AK812_SmicGene16414 [Symbiodinium microadriaticum]